MSRDGEWPANVPPPTGSALWQERRGTVDQAAADLRAVTGGAVDDFSIYYAVQELKENKPEAAAIVGQIVGQAVLDARANGATPEEEAQIACQVVRQFFLSGTAGGQQ